MSFLSPKQKKRSGANGSRLPSLMDDFFGDRFFGPGFFSPVTSSVMSEMPSANIRETKDAYVVELSAPGLKKEDFKIEIDDGVLTVSCEKEEEKKEEETDYKRREFSYTSFTRSFSLPENAQEDKVNAKYNDGILELSIPKKDVTVSKPKKQIKVD